MFIAILLGAFAGACFFGILFWDKVFTRFN